MLRKFINRLFRYGRGRSAPYVAKIIQIWRNEKGGYYACLDVDGVNRRVFADLTPVRFLPVRVKKDAIEPENLKAGDIVRLETVRVSFAVGVPKVFVAVLAKCPQDTCLENSYPVEIGFISSANVRGQANTKPKL